MDGRFRIRTQDGRLLEPRTMDIFAELVRSGVVRPEDEVFDALTGAWTRAEVHPMVALFRDPLSHPDAERLHKRYAEQVRAANEGTDAESGTEQEGSDTAATPAPTGEDAPGAPAEPGEAAAETPAEADISLELAPAPEASPEEEQRAFIEKLEQERRYDDSRTDRGTELPLVTAQTGEVRRLPDRASPAAPFGGARQRPPQRKLTPARSNRVGMVALFIVLVASAIVFARLARPALGTGEADAENATGVERVRAPRAVTRTEEQIRQDAYEGFVEDVEVLGDELAPGPVPSTWLEGAYLADPSSYPEIRPYWERFEAYVDEAQAQEAALYRESYLTAATMAGVSGPLRSLRMATALEDFGSTRRERLELYARVRELAESALALHDLVVELEGRISYEPIRGPRVSADPVIEAAGIDAEAQARLDAALDRLLAALHGTDGTSPRDRAQIPEVLVEGLRALSPGP